MKSLILLVLLAGMAFSSAEIMPLIKDTNSSEPMPVFSISFGSFFPMMFGPNSDRGNVFDDAIDPREPVADASNDTSENVIIIVREQVFFPDDNLGFPNIIGPNPSDLQLSFEQSFLLQAFGILDLSWKNLTGAELSRLLAPQVTTLILSNARVTGVTAESFAPVQDTLRELRLDNCTVPLSALTMLSNLRFLNLSYNGLNSFEWFPQLSDSIEVLDLSHNEFKEVRPELSVLTNLRELYLQHNSISVVEENPLAQLANLEILSLTMNVLEKVYISSLNNLQEVDLDWNYLRLFGDVQLPVHRLTVKLASNPWRCDCSMLQAKESYDILDLDLLQCANQQSYAYCVDCKRYFLPEDNGRLVANLTKDSIDYLGCSGITDQYFVLRQAIEEMRDREPEKLVQLGLLLVTGVLLMIAAVIMCKQSCSKNKQSWHKIQKIPQWSFDKLKKPQEVPYIIIDESNYKA